MFRNTGVVSELRGAPAFDGEVEPDYRVLGRIRQGLNELERFTESVSREHGCTASMYQLLLVAKNSRRGRGLDIGMLAAALSVRHPSAAEMVRKAQGAGFVVLHEDRQDARRVLVELTGDGEHVLESIARSHAARLRELRPAITSALLALA